MNFRKDGEDDQILFDSLRLSTHASGGALSREKVGRNDPCPCGSGRKYKHCCLRQDQARRRQQREAAPSSLGGPTDVGSLLQQLRRLNRRARRSMSAAEAEELERQADEIESMAAYAVMQDEILDAMETLEEHGGDFERMMAHPASAIERALHLCEEDRFDDLRFTADDLGRAFEVVGYPAPGAHGMTDRDLDIITEAAVYLAGDEEDRLTRSRRLLMALPAYVAAGRYRDAWLLQHSAYRMVKEPEESEPFTFAMVTLALEAWGDRMRAHREALFAELGVEVLPPTSDNLEKAMAMAEGLAADPAAVARLERFYEAHPEVQTMMQDQLLELEREAASLLERRDARRILPSPDETAPWLETFVERTAHLQAQARSAPGVELAQEAQEIMGAVLREMVTAVYTPERIEELAAELKAYRRDLKAAGEHEAAQQAESALMVTATGMDPEQSGFLFATCYASLRLALRILAEAEPGK